MGSAYALGNDPAEAGQVGLSPVDDRRLPHIIQARTRRRREWCIPMIDPGTIWSE